MLGSATANAASVAPAVVLPPALAPLPRGTIEIPIPGSAVSTVVINLLVLEEAVGLNVYAMFVDCLLASFEV